MAEDVDHAGVAVAEVAAQRDQTEDDERRDHREDGCQPEHPLVGLVRDEVLLQEDLQAVGEGLEDAEGAGAVGTDAVLEVRDDLALEPDHQHGRQQGDAQRDGGLDDDDQHDLEVDRAGEHRVQGEEVHDSVSTRISVTGLVASISTVGDGSPCPTAMATVPMGTASPPPAAPAAPAGK